MSGLRALFSAPPKRADLLVNDNKAHWTLFRVCARQSWMKSDNGNEVNFPFSLRCGAFFTHKQNVRQRIRCRTFESKKSIYRKSLRSCRTFNLYCRWAIDVHHKVAVLFFRRFLKSVKNERKKKLDSNSLRLFHMVLSKNIKSFELKRKKRDWRV